MIGPKDQTRSSKCGKDSVLPMSARWPDKFSVTIAEKIGSKASELALRRRLSTGQDPPLIYCRMQTHPIHTLYSSAVTQHDSPLTAARSISRISSPPSHRLTSGPSTTVAPGSTRAPLSTWAISDLRPPYRSNPDGPLRSLVHTHARVTMTPPPLLQRSMP
jgi:hypothetical protein